MPSIIFKLTSSLKAGAGAGRSQVGGVLANYMDDTGKAMLSRDNEYFLKSPQTEPEPLMAPPISEDAKQVVVGKEDTRGRLEAHGFLEEYLNRRGLALVSPADRIQRRKWVQDITDLWLELWARTSASGGIFRNAKSNQRYGYRFIGAINPVVLADMNRRGIQAPETLRELNRRVWSDYCRSRGWGDDRLGWIIGYHYDKAHYHCHVFVFPRSREGRRLVFSNNYPIKGQRVHYLNEVSRSADIHLERMVTLKSDMSLPIHVPLPQIGMRLLQSRMLVHGYLEHGAEACETHLRKVVLNQWLPAYARVAGTAPTSEEVSAFMPIMTHRIGIAQTSMVQPSEPDSESEMEARWWMRSYLGYESLRLNGRHLTEEEKRQLREQMHDLLNGASDAENPQELRQRIVDMMGQPSPETRPLAVARSSRQPWKMALAAQFEHWLARGETTMRDFLAADAVAMRLPKDLVLQTLLSEEIVPLRTNDHLPIQIHSPRRLIDSPTAPLLV